MVPLRLSLADNYDEFYEGAPACGACGTVRDPEWVSPTFRLGLRRPDGCVTRDSAHLVSQRFVDACAGAPGARFLPLPADPGAFLMVVDPIMKMDFFRCRPKLHKWCGTCARWVKMHGSTGWYFDEDALPLGFSRSDVVFWGHRPEILVHPETAALLKTARLRGVGCWPIRDRAEPWDPFYDRMYGLNAKVDTAGQHVVDEQGGRSWLNYQHLRVEGADPKRLPTLTGQLHRAYLTITDGATLFVPPRADNNPLGDGVRIFSVEEVAQHTRFFRKTLHENVRNAPDEFAAISDQSSVDLLAWYDSLTPVAAMVGSADLIVTDPTVLDFNDEPELIMFDHELLYGSPIDGSAVVSRWTNFADFLDALYYQSSPAFGSTRPPRDS